MKQWVVILSLIFICACASLKREVITNSTIKLEGKSTNIRDLIEIDGVYVYSTMFFEDGSYVNFLMEKPEDGKITNLRNSLETWKEGKQTRWGTYWGVYTIQNDTIIVHSYDKGTLLKRWSLDEIRYKVIDRKTIKRIYNKGLLKVDEKYYRESGESPWIDGNPLHFIPADSLPSADNWLKENKWIWRNEADWKEYMQKIKLKKK